MDTITYPTLHLSAVFAIVYQQNRPLHVAVATDRAAAIELSPPSTTDVELIDRQNSSLGGMV